MDLGRAANQEMENLRKIAVTDRLNVHQHLLPALWIHINTRINRMLHVAVAGRHAVSANSIFSRLKPAANQCAFIIRDLCQISRRHNFQNNHLLMN